MIIPEDGCLPKITRTGFAAFNNVMIIKVPEKYRKPGETIYQLATLDRSKKGERWPADRYIDGSNPELESETLEKDETEKFANTNEKAEIVNSGEKKDYLNCSESLANKFERNKTLHDNAQTYYERIPTHNIDTVRPETSQLVTDNTFRTYSLPVFNPPLHNNDFPKNRYDGLLGDRPPPKSLFGQEDIFDPKAQEHDYIRFPNETNFHKGSNSQNERNYPNNGASESKFTGFSRKNLTDNFSHKRKYSNLRQNRSSANDLFGESNESSFGNAYFDNCPPRQDIPENGLFESHHVNQNFPIGPNTNHMNGPIPFLPAPSFHLVRPFKPSPFAKPPDNTCIRPYGDLPSDITRMPANIPRSFDGNQRNIPSCSGNFNRMNNLNSQNNAIRYDIDPQFRDNCSTADYSRRNPHQYRDAEVWHGQNEPKPPYNETYRDRKDATQGNNYKFRSQQRPWRYNNSKNYLNKGRNDFSRGRRRDNRYQNNNRNNRKNDNKSHD